MRDWFIPVLIACVLHLLVISVLLMGWDSSVEYKPVVVPRHIQAKVVELKPKPAKAKPAKKTRKPVVKKTRLKKPKKVTPVKKKPPQKKVTKPAVTKKVEPVKKEPVKPNVEEEKVDEEKLAEQRRLRELADALAEEGRQQQLALEQEKIQSYSQQIRSDIENKWSRPPSARNGMEVTLIIQLVPSGELIDVQVIKRSGNDAFDTSAVNAVRKVEKFEVPEDYELFDKYFRKLTLPFRAEGLSR
ncbi:MAG: cell envelope integrity protein TolA [Pseudomonadales bacterium]|nr:cell envelope integrity protein TolA [Pseudomonadales bacterium]